MASILIQRSEQMFYFSAKKRATAKPPFNGGVNLMNDYYAVFRKTIITLPWTRTLAGST